jgi:hypothetical protein
MALSDSAGIGSALPSQVGVTSGYALTTDGTVATWNSVGGGGGVTTVGTFSTTGITNGASISSTTITLGPADGTKPGLLKALGSVGSSPAAAGASLGSDGTLTLQPADGTHPGVVTSAAQTIGGLKLFSAGVGTGAAGASHASLTAISGFPYLHMGANADSPIASTACLYYATGASFGTFINIPISGENILFTSVGGGTPFWQMHGTSGDFDIQYGKLNIIANGTLPSAITMKSPDGTTYTLHIANGGTLVIA